MGKNIISAFLLKNFAWKFSEQEACDGMYRIYSWVWYDCQRSLVARNHTCWAMEKCKLIAHLLKDRVKTQIVELQSNKEVGHLHLCSQMHLKKKIRLVMF